MNCVGGNGEDEVGSWFIREMSSFLVSSSVYLLASSGNNFEIYDRTHRARDSAVWYVHLPVEGAWKDER